MARQKKIVTFVESSSFMTLIIVTLAINKLIRIVLTRTRTTVDVVMYLLVTLLFTS